MANLWKKYQCAECDRKFENLELLKNHIVNQQQCMSIISSCLKCSRSDFTLSCGLNKHVKSCRFVNFLNKKPAVKLQKLKHQCELERYKCDECKKEFPNFESLTNHIIQAKDLFSSRYIKCANCFKSDFSLYCSLSQHETECLSRYHFDKKPVVRLQKLNLQAEYSLDVGAPEYPPRVEQSGREIVSSRNVAVKFFLELSLLLIILPVWLIMTLFGACMIVE